MEENKRSRSTIFVFLCDLSFPNCRLLTYHLIFLPLPSPLAFPFPRMKGYRIIVAFSRILNSSIIYSASRRNVVDEVNGHRCIRWAINIMDVWNNLKWPVSFLDLRSKLVKLEPLFGSTRVFQIMPCKKPRSLSLREAINSFISKSASLRIAPSPNGVQLQNERSSPTILPVKSFATVDYRLDRLEKRE